jgi:hypothetical protein
MSELGDESWEEREGALNELRELKAEAKGAIQAFQSAKREHFARWNSLRDDLGSDPAPTPDDNIQDNLQDNPQHEIWDEDIEDELLDNSQNEIQRRTHSGKRFNKDKWLSLKVSAFLGSYI